MRKSKKIKWLRDMWEADSVRLTAERNAFEAALGEKEFECDEARYWARRMMQERDENAMSLTGWMQDAERYCKNAAYYEKQRDALQSKLDIATKMMIVSKDVIELLQGDYHTLLAELAKIRGEK